MATQEYLTVEHLTIKDITRIFSKIKVNPETGCWEWQAGRSRHYGKIKFRGRTELTHRLLYAWAVEPIPHRVKGQKTPQLDHLICDNPICCNPTHLKLVPPKANTLRSANAPAAINARKTHCSKGHLLPLNPNGKGTYGRDCLQCHRDRYKNETVEQRKHRQERLARDHQRKRYGPNRDLFLKRNAKNLLKWKRNHGLIQNTSTE